MLANTDLEAVGRTLQIGLTPVIIADEIEWTDAAALEAERKALAGAFEAWRADWESRDTDKYLAHYARALSLRRPGPRRMVGAQAQGERREELDQGRRVARLA